ncbi:hypothetical protein C3V43_09040 [Bacteroides heparinolyticus]|uniref:hypothetical protein n=1 Tax=Prevotella heparinolytica TaxID=28113 RepID=UPI000D040E72|nr:hypothetical protein C3V43_09040 [Bacteroides heparinolyticus]
MAGPITLLYGCCLLILELLRNYKQKPFGSLPSHCRRIYAGKWISFKAMSEGISFGMAFS